MLRIPMSPRWVAATYGASSVEGDYGVHRYWPVSPYARPYVLAWVPPGWGVRRSGAIRTGDKAPSWDYDAPYTRIWRYITAEYYGEDVQAGEFPAVIYRLDLYP